MAEYLHIYENRIIQNHVQVIFELNRKLFCLSISPVRKHTLPLYYSQFCNALVQTVVQCCSRSDYFPGEGLEVLRRALLELPKPELLALSPRSEEISNHFCVQFYFHHGKRLCGLQSDEHGEPVIRLTDEVGPFDSRALDAKDQHHAGLHIKPDIPGYSAKEISITPKTNISTMRICGEVCMMDKTLRHCIAARNAADRGALCWAGPERQQLIIRHELQTACRENPDKDSGIRVPALLGYVYDDSVERDSAVRRDCVMGGLYQRVEGITLRESVSSASQGEARMRLLADQISKLVEGLHERGFVWGGEHPGAHQPQLLVDCVVVDRQGDPWLIDGFGAAYHEDVVQSDCQALIFLYDQMKLDSPAPTEVPDAEGEPSSDDDV